MQNFALFKNRSLINQLLTNIKYQSRENILFLNTKKNYLWVLLYFLVNNDTTTRVKNPKGIEIMPGFLSGIGAVAGFNP